MTTDTFDFTFKQEGKTIPASVAITVLKGHKEMPFKYPLYRVYADSKPSGVFVFYEVNAPEQKFFWYRLESKKQLIAESIVKKLEKMKEFE